MAQTEKKVTLTVDVQAQIGQYEKSIKQIQDGLNKLSLSGSTKDDFTKIFNNYKNEFNNLKTYLANNQLSSIDEKAVEKSMHNIDTAYKQLINKLQSHGVNTSFLVKDQKAIKELQKGVQNYTSKISGANKAYQDQLKQVNKITTELKRQQALQGVNKQNEAAAKANLDAQQKTLESLKQQAEEQKKIKEAAETKLKTDAENWANDHGPKSRFNTTNLAKADNKNIEDATARQQELNEQIKQQGTIVQSAQIAYNNYSTAVKKTNSDIQAQENNLTAAESVLTDTKTKLDELANVSIGQVVGELQKVSGINWKDFGIDLTQIKSFDELKVALDNLSGNATQRAHDVIANLAPTLKDAGDAGQNMKSGIDQGTKAIEDMTAQESAIAHLQDRLLRFFGIDNAVNLFKRAIRSAFDTVKDLDAVMTETAVVTEFDVSDMWDQLGDYTKRANELGVTIHDAYEAATLYYQQGLSTNEVMAVSNETLKMARIAGLDAAEATDRMTNALRGFNMEITNANAQNINDVYSNLAAKTASDVDEISTAMTKVASLANNAGMGFENTAAFLSQIVETTRESAETAGTALKTVIARFTEVKKAVSEGELTAIDEEGEEIDVNKVSQALRTAGIDMNEYFTGMKGLDEIFIELASRWDSLDNVQQRYIATTAAGSRQQSRFIAMMQDYDRTMELVGVANNSAGASQEQFNKTLDSLESKLNELKNSWDTFIMNLMNSDFIKFFVDAANTILTALNGITSGMDGAGKSLTNIGLLFGGLAIGKKALKGIFSSAGVSKILGVELGKSVTDASKSSELAKAFKLFKTNFKDNLTDTFKPSNFKDSFKNIGSLLKPALTASPVSLSMDDLIKVQGGSDAFINNLANQVGGDIDNFQKKLQEQFNQLGTINLDTIEVSAKGISSEQQKVAKAYIDAERQKAEATLNTQRAQEAAEQQQQKTNTGLMALGASLVAVGALLNGFASLLDKTGHSTAATVIRDIATGVTILGTALMVIPPILKSINVAFSTGPLIAFTAAAAALVTIIKLLADFIETDAERMERLEKSLEATSAAAKEVTDHANEMADAIHSIGQQQDEITKLIPGTEAYNQKVKETTQSIKDLIAQFPELQKYATYESGAINLDVNSDEVQQALASAQSRSVNLKIAENAQRNQIEQEKTNKADDIIANNFGPEWYTFADELEQLVASGAAYSSNSIQEFRNLVEQSGKVMSGTLETVLNDWEDGGTTFAKELPGLIELITNDILPLRQDAADAQDAYVNSLKITAAEQLGYAGDIEDIVFATEDLLQAGEDAVNNIEEKNIGDNADYKKWLEDTYDEVEINSNGSYKYKNEGDTEWTEVGTDVAIAQYKASKSEDTYSNAMIDQTAAALTEIFKKVEPETTEQDVKGTNEDTGVQSEFINLYKSLFGKVGAESAATLTKSLFDSISASDLNTEQQRNLAKRLSAFDWGADNSLEQLNLMFKELGIDAIDAEGDLGDLISQIQELAKTAGNVDLDSLRSALAGGQDIREKAAKGETSGFTDEEYKNAVELGLNPEDFVQGFDGTYIFQGAADALVSAIDQASQNYLNDAVATNNQNVAQGEFIANLVNGLGGVDLTNFSTLNTEELGVKLWNSFFGQGKSDSLISDLQAQGFQVDENASAMEIAEIVKQAFQQLVGDNGTILDANQTKQEEELPQQQQLLEQQNFQNEVSDAGLDMAELEAIAQHYETINQLAPEVAQNVALANMKLNSGLGEIIDSYDDWTALIDESSGTIKASSSDDIKAFNDLKKSVNKMLNTSEDLSDAFWDNADNMKNLQKVAEGDVDALGDLQKAAAKDYLLNLGIDDEAAQIGINNFINTLENTEIPKLEAGVEWNDTGSQQFIAAFNRMAQTANLDADQIQSAVKAMGFNAKIKYVKQVRKVPKTVTKEDISESTYTAKDGTEHSKITKTTSSYINGYSYQYGEFPVVETLTSTGSSGGGVSVGNINAGNANGGSSGGSGGSGGGGGGGGGGGSSSKPKVWKNPYDELYNLQEKINESLRDREKLERQYDRILKERTSSAYEVRKNQLDEIANLKKEIDLQNQLLQGRRDQLAKIGTEKHEDEDGNQRTFNSWGVTKYASYNEVTGLITIDWAAIDKVKDEELGGAIEAYIDRLEEISESMEETQETIEDMEDTIEEIRDRGKEEYLELEDRIYEALVEEQQKVIDEYSSIADQIDESNSKVIDNIRESIDLERQIRDNTKTEEDIADKEARLAYLRRDTSGANQLEIMQLEKELEDARESYQDTLINQALDKIDQDNAKAAEQRQAQIELMQAQLDSATENGIFWPQVYSLLANSFNDDGTLNNNSKLVELLQNSEAFRGLSFFGQENWIDELVKTWLIAQEGYSSWQDSMIERSSSITLADGTQLFKQNGTWVDASGTAYDDIQYDTNKHGYIGSVASTSKPDEKVEEISSKPVSPADELLKASQTHGYLSYGMTGEQVAAIQRALVQMGYDLGIYGVDGIWTDYTEAAVRKFQSDVGTVVDGVVGDETREKFRLKGYKTGGLNTETGPAWLDGTRTKPELILDAEDTSLFLQIRDILRGRELGSNSNKTTNGDNYFDIDISGVELSNDYDVDQLAERIKEQIVNDAMYRNVNAINFIR